MHAQCLRNMRTLKANTASLLLKICLIINFIKRIYAVPPEYCLQNLNRSNCNLMPLKVFTYYKPGSRCELEEWRGCPTYNRFDTEENCINICINYDYTTSKTGFHSGGVKRHCVKPLNIYKCNKKATKAFVYNKAKNDCEEIIWTGCPQIGNVFEEKLDCLQTCYKGDLNWYKSIKMLSNKIADQLSKMLNSLLITDSDATTNHIKTNQVTENEKKVNKKQSEKTLKIKSTNTPVTKINEIKSKISSIDMNTEITNYISTTDYVKTNNVNEEGDITTTDVTKFESSTVEIPTTAKVEPTSDMTTEVKLTTANVTSTTQEITKSPRRKRTKAWSVGTAKAVVLIQDLE
ncbi:uncharacterized protein LOC124533370 [Vanessa cardui]|uniref:uncharacterized protein LOC124533370 n=1 Tax=Vanessa cardui TaxID=171605 RepID=UPI001F13781C|nr:uncharacterized protein LOC124533370 [Vanessa cardui]